MKRKLIAFVLVFALLASLSPAVAADEPSATPTVEEILSEYHRKAFEAQTQGDAETASAWSRRSGDEKTLEQETVDTLTEAGYEAYNVTADNYETLEAELKTDFAALGLDPEGSYIVVVHGEESSTDINCNARNGGNFDQITEDFGSGAFEYTQDGTTYTMRYITITADSEPDLHTSSTYSLEEMDSLSDYVGDVFYALASLGIDSVAKGLPLSSVVSLLADWTNREVYVVLDRDELTLHAATEWVRNYIQIYNTLTGAWHTVQCSSYAVSQARCVGYVDRIGQTASEWVDTGEVSATTYSPFYNYPSIRKERAVEGYLLGTKLHDCTGNIGFYFCDEDGVSINTGGEPLFVHEENLGYLLPYVQYE